MPEIHTLLNTTHNTINITVVRIMVAIMMDTVVIMFQMDITGMR